MIELESRKNPNENHNHNLSILDKKILDTIKLNNNRDKVNKRFGFILGNKYITYKVESIRWKLFILDIAILLLSIISSIFALIATEKYLTIIPIYGRNDNVIINFNMQFEETTMISYFRLTVSLLTFCMILMIIFYYFILLEYNKAKHNFFPDDNLFSSGQFRYLLCEVCLNFFHSPPKLNYRIYGKFETDFLLTIILLFFRSYHFLKFFSFHSKWSSYKSEKICLETNAVHSSLFAIKSEFKNRAFTMIFFVLFLSIFILGYSIRTIEVFEMKVNQNGQFQDWRYIWNGIWCIIITMTTVCFGDFYPVSFLGRLIAVISCLWGLFLITMMIAAITSSFEFNANESISYEGMKSAKYDFDYGTSSIKLLQSAQRYYNFLKKSSENPELVLSYAYRCKKSNLFQNLGEALFKFRKLRLSKDENINLIAIEKSLQSIDYLINVDFEILINKCVVMKEIEEILIKYKTLQKIIKQKSIDIFKEIEQINIIKECKFK